MIKNWFGNLRLAYKLAIGFGVTLGLTLLVLYTSVTGVLRLRGHIHQLSDKALVAQSNLLEFTTAASHVRILQYRVTGYQGAAGEAIAKQVDENVKAADAALESYSKGVTDPTDKQNFEAVEGYWHKYESIWKDNRAKIIDLDPTKAFQFFEDNTTKLYQDSLLPSVQKTLDWNKDFGKKTSTEADEASSAVFQKVIEMGTSAVIVGLFSAWVITRSITRPIAQVSDRLACLRTHCAKNLSEGLGAFSKGDLTVAISPVTTPVEIKTTDEVGQMAESFNQTLVSIQSAMKSYNEARLALNDVMGKVSESANQVSSTSQTLAAAAEESTASSTEISAGSQKLALSASASASTMTQVVGRVQDVKVGSETQSSLIEQVSTSISDANDGLQNVTNSARAMTSTAEQGNRAVSETVSAMTRVREEVERSTERVKELDIHGQEIGKIVETIEQIAQQTNLLALNAAIEAARAGEHGRGFAVVADEVRKLAEKSSASTKQIAELIGTVRKTVGETVSAIERAQLEVVEGSKKSVLAGSSLDQILEAANTVRVQNESVAEIAHSIAVAIEDVEKAALANSNAASEMSTGAQHVQESIETVAAISQESAAGAEQMTASVEEVSAAATELAMMSQDLQAIVASFKLETAAPKQPDTRLRVA
jgi:methyl-accepting chemotaxis protein